MNTHPTQNHHDEKVLLLMDPFKTHVIALLSIYDTGQGFETIPQYNGPRDWQTEIILNGLEGLMKKNSSAKHIRDGGESSERERASTVGSLVTVVNAQVTKPEHEPALPTTDLQCPKCGQSVLDSSLLGPRKSSIPASSSFSTRQTTIRVENSSSGPETAQALLGAVPPLDVPPGPLAAAQIETDMTSLEELRLLKAQISDVARVCNAVTKGDLGQRITVPVQGVLMAQMKDLVNTMADKLDTFMKDIIRVAHEAGQEGKLGGQTNVEGEGQWALLAGNVDTMVRNLTNQTRSVSEVCRTITHGELFHRVHIDGQGEMLDLKNNMNNMVDQLNVLVKEVTDLSFEVGTRGTLGAQAVVPEREGAWKILVDHVNVMAMNHTSVVRATAEVSYAITKGDLTKAMTMDLRGEDLEMKAIVNEMTYTLSSFADELMGLVTDVGVEGQLCDHARSPEFRGTWKEVINNVYGAVNNWTLLVRTMAVVIAAVGKGDLTKRITGVPVSGEMLNLVNAINDMVDQLAAWTTEVKNMDGKTNPRRNPDGKEFQGIWQEIMLGASLLAASSAATKDLPT